MRFWRIGSTAALVLALGLAACTQAEEPPATPASSSAASPSSRASLNPNEAINGVDVPGTVAALAIQVGVQLKVRFVNAGDMSLPCGSVMVHETTPSIAGCIDQEYVLVPAKAASNLKTAPTAAIIYRLARAVVATRLEDKQRLYYMPAQYHCAAGWLTEQAQPGVTGLADYARANPEPGASTDTWSLIDVGVQKFRTKQPLADCANLK